MILPVTPAEVRQWLQNRAEPGYLAFSSSLIPGEKGMLGVRLPELRALAAKIAKSGAWREYLEAPEGEYFEEVMLRGMVIGAAPVPLEEKIPYIRAFVPLIRNWSICDSFCVSLKCRESERTALWELIRPYFDRSGEYEVRFAAVMGLNRFCTPEYIDELLQLLAACTHAAYYAKMAAAWALSVCYVKFPDKTMPVLIDPQVDAEIRRLALRKILESRRITSEQREEIQGLRKGGLS